MNEIEKEFVLYPEALELKGLGFDKPCMKEFHSQELLNNSTGSEMTNTDLVELYGEQDVITAPTYSQTFKWFRENYNQHCFIHYHSKPEYTFAVYNDIEMYWTLHEKISFDTYEEAELACLRKLIEIVK